MRLNLENANLYEIMLRSGKVGSTRRIIAGAISLTSYSDAAQFIDPNGGIYNVTLPATEKGRLFFIFNIGGAGQIVVKTSLGITLATLIAGGGCAFISSATEWGIVSGGGAGVSSVREVTAAGAVTVDATTDDVVIINKAAGAATTVNLPAVSARDTKKFLRIVDGKGDAATNPITIVPNGTDTIVGQASWIIDFNYGSVMLWALPSGGKWYV